MGKLIQYVLAGLDEDKAVVDVKVAKGYRGAIPEIDPGSMVPGAEYVLVFFSEDRAVIGAVVQAFNKLLEDQKPIWDNWQVLHHGINGGHNSRFMQFYQVPIISNDGQFTALEWRSMTQEEYELMVTWGMADKLNIIKIQRITEFKPNEYIPRG